jgi:hypothetical protein
MPLNGWLTAVHVWIFNTPHYSPKAVPRLVILVSDFLILLHQRSSTGATNIELGVGFLSSQKAISGCCRFAIFSLHTH